MTSDLRFIIQVSANIFAAGFFVVLGFSQFAEFLLGRSLRHLAATLSWFWLVPVMILRTAVLSKPPLLDPQFVTDWSTVFWLLSLLFGLAWGLMRMSEKRAEFHARKRLGLNEPNETERQHGH